MHTHNTEQKSQCHGVVWDGRDLKDHLVPAALPWARTPSTRPGCSKPLPTRPWTLPGRGQPQLLWATCSRLNEISIHITGGVGTHNNREDIAVKAQIVQTGKMGLKVLVKALTNKTSLPKQGSDSQKSFLSSSLFYPLEQLRTDRWTQSCLWPADPEHTPLEGKAKGYHHHTMRQCIHTPCEAVAQNGQRNRNITHESFSDEPQLMVHYSSWGRSISTCYL